MEETENPFASIHNRNPWKTYLETLITADSLISEGGRKRQDLCGKWNFTQDPYNVCLRQNWPKFSTSLSIYETFKPYFSMLGLNPDEITPELAEQVDLREMARDFVPLDFDFDQWPEMEIPSCWNMKGETFELYEGSMVFTRSFECHPEGNERVHLRVGAANYRCAVFLDGKHLGTHLGGGGEFYVEVTDYLSGKENRLILVVDNTRRDDQVPMDYCDWFNYGGVHREVELIFTPTTFIRNFSLNLVPDSSYRKIKCGVMLDKQVSGIANLNIPELGEPISIEVLEGYGSLVFDREPELWSPDNPKLYDVELSFGEDRLSDRVGFREIKTDGDTILLNGNPLYLRGISCHEESVKNGRSLLESEIIENLNLIRELEGNFMRLAHYPHSSRTARLADEMGILLWEEIPVYWAIDFENKKTLDDARNQLSELIYRDWRRASVIIWSVGNENDDTQPRFDFMKNLADLAREIDPTRLVSAACLVNWEEKSIRDSLAEILDIVGINEYFDWYQPGIEMLNELFEKAKILNKPFIISEVGAGALAGEHGDPAKFFTEEKQEKVYQDQIAILRDITNIKGMTPWILYDFRTPLRTNRYQRYYNRKGLLSPDKKQKKLAFDVLRKFYREKKD